MEKITCRLADGCVIEVTEKTVTVTYSYCGYKQTHFVWRKDVRYLLENNSLKGYHKAIRNACDCFELSIDN